MEILTNSMHIGMGWELTNSPVLDRWWWGGQGRGAMGFEVLPMVDVSYVPCETFLYHWIDSLF